MSETKTEGSFKIKAPQKKEPVAEQKVEAPVKKAVEEKAEPKKDINQVASINEESGNIKLDLNKKYAIVCFIEKINKSIVLLKIFESIFPKVFDT